MAWYLAHTSRSRPQPFSAHTRNLHFDSFCTNQVCLLLTHDDDALSPTFFSNISCTVTSLESQRCAPKFILSSLPHTDQCHWALSTLPTMPAVLLAGSPTALCSSEKTHAISKSHFLNGEVVLSRTGFREQQQQAAVLAVSE